MPKTRYREKFWQLWLPVMPESVRGYRNGTEECKGKSCQELIQIRNNVKRHTVDDHYDKAYVKAIKDAMHIAKCDHIDEILYDLTISKP